MTVTVKYIYAAQADRDLMDKWLRAGGYAEGPSLIAFFAMHRLAERERCALICDENGAAECGAKIREDAK